MTTNDPLELRKLIWEIHEVLSKGGKAGKKIKAVQDIIDSKMLMHSIKTKPTTGDTSGADVEIQLLRNPR